MENKSKTAYLELLRIIACFFVIVNHTNSGIFLAHNPGDKTWWVSITYFFVCKVAVPVFLMISGALLLGRRDDGRKYFSRILRILIVIVVFSFLYYVRSMYMAGTPINVIEFFVMIYQYHITNAYWYLYLYLGILVVLPLFQTLSIHMKKWEFQLLLLVSVAGLGALPVIVRYFPDAACSYMFTEPFFSVYVGVFFLGYYLTHFVEVKKSYAIISAVLFVGVTAVEVLLTYREYYIRPGDFLFLEDRTYLNVTLASAALFYLVRYMGSVVKQERFWKVISFVGGCSFGIYLFSDMFVSIYEQFYNDLSMQVHSMIAVFVYELLIFFSGMIITVILKKIPYVKKIV